LDWRPTIENWKKGIPMEKQSIQRQDLKKKRKSCFHPSSIPGPYFPVSLYSRILRQSHRKQRLVAIWLQSIIISDNFKLTSQSIHTPSTWYAHDPNLSSLETKKGWFYKRLFVTLMLHTKKFPVSLSKWPIFAHTQIDNTQLLFFSFSTFRLKVALL
jgi:hypothetical protein